MGCLKSRINKIIFIALLIAFFFFGGCDFVKTKYSEFTSPPRDVMIEKSKDFGNFESVSSDYRLTRSLNFGGYRKFNAQYLPTGQKLSILDLKNSNIVEPNDFYSNTINEKIDEILSKFEDSFITFENLEITQKGVISAQGKNIPYVNFKAKVKNIPFKNVEGMLGAYETVNVTSKKPVSSVKIIISMRDIKKYNQQLNTDFIKSIKF